MKCIIREFSLKGGAPRSILQHIKALISFGYQISVMTSGGDAELEKEYREISNEVIIKKSPAELWDQKDHYRLYEEYIWEYKYIKKNNPDLIIALGEINGALYSRISKVLGIPIIIYIAGGELNTHQKAMELWNNSEVVCFSQENAEAINQYVKADHINVISNRIEVRELFDDFNEHYEATKSEINILIVSRLSKRKVDSIYSFLKYLNNFTKIGTIINVKIAGDGDEFLNIENFVITLNNSCLRVEMLGHIDDLTEYFRWAHIIAGKGRSVIEPIMMNRIGCVIGEDGKIAFCNGSTFENLYHFNFAGRNLETEDSIKVLTNMIDSIKNGTVEKKGILDTAKLVSDYYSAEYLPEKLESVLSCLPKKKSKNGIPMLWLQYLRFIYKKVKGRIS